MTNYVLGKLSKGSFVGLSVFLTIRDASIEESRLRLGGQNDTIIAELESVASYEIKNDLKVVRVLTPRCVRRIAAGDYVDGEGLLVYVMGWLGYPFIPGEEKAGFQFNGVSVHKTLRDADIARGRADARQSAEDGIVHRVVEMRVLAWIKINDSLTLVRTPVGPETPLDILEPPIVAPEPEYVPPEEPDEAGEEPLPPPARRSLFVRVWDCIWDRNAA